MTDNIYTLTSEYKNEIATETNASLRSCELLYQIQSALLEKHDNNIHDKKYQKEISTFRKEVALSKSQFNYDVAVGKHLTIDLPGGRYNNEIATLTKKQIYNHYCTKPRTTKPKEPKIDYKAKYEDQLRMIEYIRVKMGNDAWNKFLSKYHSSSSNTAAMVED